MSRRESYEECANVELKSLKGRQLLRARARAHLQRMTIVKMARTRRARKEDVLCELNNDTNQRLDHFSL